MPAPRFFSTLKGGGEPALKKLRNRLLAVNLISLTLVIAIAFSIIYINFYNRTQNEIEKTLSSIPRGVLENILITSQSENPSFTSGGVAVTSDRQITISGDPRLPVDYSKSFVVNIMNDGNITVFSLLDMDNGDYVEAIETVLTSSSAKGSLNILGRTWRYSLEQSPGLFTGYQYSIVFLDIEDTNRGLGALAASLFIIGIVAVCAILLVSMLIANRAILPVEESIVRQRRFVADASHELKTPIAVIAANAEAAKGAAQEAHSDAGSYGKAATREESPGVSQWIDNIAYEANRMNGLVENLLTLAKAEEKRAEPAAFDLIDVVCEETDRVEAFLFERGVSLDLEFAQQERPVSICSDRAKIQAVLSVLLENAVKYTPPGGRVSVSAGRKPRPATGVYISVSNTGVYISPENLEHIFDRFFRSDPSRNSETGGHGIGLSIASGITRSLGGELTAASVPDGDGSGKAVNTFTLSLMKSS